MSRLAQMLSLINQLEKDGVIARYAIGGAVGATFYLEPIATLDVDIFVIFRGETPGSPDGLCSFFHPQVVWLRRH